MHYSLHVGVMLLFKCCAIIIYVLHVQFSFMVYVLQFNIMISVTYFAISLILC